MTQGTSNKSQFRLATLLTVMGCFCLFFAVAVWIVQSETLNTSANTHFLTEPLLILLPLLSLEAVIAGAWAALIGCIAGVLLMLILAVESKPRSFTAPVFFGLVVMAVVMTLSNQGDSFLRLLLAMALNSIAMLIESLSRKLPVQQRCAAIISIFVCLGYYVLLFTASVLASK